MTNTIRRNLGSAFALWSCGFSLLILALLGGCANGGDAAMTLRRPAGQRPDIDAKAASGTLAIPAGQAFNITSFKSGQEGSARGESKPSGTDGAHCRAEASDGGAAWAEFQLGYCFDNTSGRPLGAVVRLHLALAASQDNGAGAKTPRAGGTTQKSEVSSSADSLPADGQPSTATTTLQYFVKDTNGTMLRQENLAAMNLERGPQAANDEPMRVFDLQLAPGRGCYLVIAGRIDVRAGSTQTASASLDAKQCSLEISWQPQSPPQSAAQPASSLQENRSTGQ